MFSEKYVRHLTCILRVKEGESRPSVFPDSAQKSSRQEQELRTKMAGADGDGNPDNSPGLSVRISESFQHHFQLPQGFSGA